MIFHAYHMLVLQILVIYALVTVLGFQGMSVANVLPLLLLQPKEITQEQVL